MSAAIQGARYWHRFELRRIEDLPNAVLRTELDAIHIAGPPVRDHLALAAHDSVIRTASRPFHGIVDLGRKMEKINLKHRGEPQAVHGHRLPGEEIFFYIGSGPMQQLTTPPRSLAWEQFVEGHGVDVVVEFIELHRCPARARLRAMQLIQQYQPETNFHGREGVPPAILRGLAKDGMPCACGAPDCYGAEMQDASGSGDFGNSILIGRCG